MLNRSQLFTACVLAASIGVFSLNATADETTIQRTTVTENVPDQTLRLPSGITLKDLNSDKSVDKAFKSLAEAAMTYNGFANVVSCLADQDKNRIKKQLGDSPMNNIDGNKNKRLNDLVNSLNDTFKAKYNAKFSVDYEKAFTNYISVATGEVTDPMLLVGRWPVDATSRNGRLHDVDAKDMTGDTGKVTPADAQQARDKTFGGEVNLEKGRNVAIATFPESHGMPVINASLIHETMSGWKFDIPNNISPQQLYDNLVANLNYIDHHRDELPADGNEASRMVSHAVVAAIYNVDLEKKANANVQPADDPARIGSAR